MLCTHCRAVSLHQGGCPRRQVSMVASVSLLSKGKHQHLIWSSKFLSHACPHIVNKLSSKLQNANCERICSHHETSPSSCHCAHTTKMLGCLHPHIANELAHAPAQKILQELAVVRLGFSTYVDISENWSWPQAFAILSASSCWQRALGSLFGSNLQDVLHLSLPCVQC